MDGVKVDLPNIESVVVLNIPCWGAGVKPWTLGSGHSKFPKSSYNDEKLEVFCVFSSFHIAQMQVRFRISEFTFTNINVNDLYYRLDYQSLID